MQIWVGEECDAQENQSLINRDDPFDPSPSSPGIAPIAGGRRQKGAVLQQGRIGRAAGSASATTGGQSRLDMTATATQLQKTAPSKNKHLATARSGIAGRDRVQHLNECLVLNCYSSSNLYDVLKRDALTVIAWSRPEIWWLYEWLVVVRILTSGFTFEMIVQTGGGVLVASSQNRAGPLCDNWQYRAAVSRLSIKPHVCQAHAISPNIERVCTFFLPLSTSRNVHRQLYSKKMHFK